MNIQNDYILRVVAIFAEMIRNMLGSESIDAATLDQALKEAAGVDLKSTKNHDSIKYLIELSAVNDENKKAIAVACLYMKDRDQFGRICAEILDGMKWSVLGGEAVQVLERIFGLEFINNQKQLCHRVKI